MEFSEFFVIFIVILIILSYIKGQYEEVEYVRSKTDGRMYLVRNLPDKQKAADLLGNLSKDLQQVVDHVHVKNDKDRESLKNLKENFNPDNISESASSVHSKQSCRTVFTPSKSVLVHDPVNVKFVTVSTASR